MNKRVFAIFLSTILLYDCIFVNLKYEIENRFLYSVFSSKFYHTVFAQATKPNDPCAKIDSCKIRRNQYSHPRCYCDYECKIYDDCCYDASSSDITLSQMNQQQESRPSLACETKAFYSPHYGILVVSECPVDYQFVDISEKCTMEENVHPVSADDGTTFRNVYCAYCHNVRQYYAWRFQFHYEGKCHSSEIALLNATIPNKMKHIIENCRYEFIRPSAAKARSCLKNVIRADVDRGLCSEFQGPVSIDNQLYRNVYCYNASIINRKPECILPQNITGLEARSYGQLVLTGMFNIRPLFERIGRKTCNGNFHYDNIKDTCVPNTCQRENCVVEFILNYKWSMELNFVTDNIIDNTFMLRLTSFLYISLPKEKYQITVGNLRGQYRCRRNGKPCCVGFALVEFINGIQMSLEATRRFKSDANNMIWTYLERRNQINTSASNEIENTNITGVCNVTRVAFTGFRSFSGQIRLTEQRIVINKTWKPPTKIPERVEGVMDISDGIGSISKLRLEKWNLQFGEKDENSQTSPATTTTPEPDLTSAWSVGTILTYATLGVSCVFLVITLSTYSYFDLFQSPSGIISKYMMATMLAAELVFIVGVGASYVTSVCTALGIISHYLWLASFTWISIFLFNVLKLMRTIYQSPGALTKGQKLSKVVYGFGFVLPFVIVLPCALLDIFSEVDIGYSDGDMCFPTGFMANLLSFTLPVVVSLCFNVVTLVITSVSISRYNNTVLLLQSVRQVRSYIPIYLRLSILCACPWLLGIIADIVQLDILRNVYIVLAGSHGTFIGISFLLAKSVRNRVKCGR